MMKISELLIGKLSQKTVFYSDNNQNGILDSQDTIKKEVFDATKNPESFAITIKEVQSTSGTGIVYADNKYYVGTKQVSISEYNTKSYYSSAIDIASICIVIFVLWFVLFPKKVSQ